MSNKTDKSTTKENKNFVIARIKSHGNHFEILVNADKALEFKKGRGIITNAIESTGIFSDLRKGIKVKDSELEECFGTIDIFKIAEKIIKDGEIQLPAAYKEKERDLKYKQVVEWLASACSDQAGRPIPAERIKSAIDQTGARIDEKKPTDEQALVVLKLIQKVMPIKVAVKRVAVKVPANFTGHLYGYLKGFIISEEWLSDGSLSCTVEIPSKLQSEFYDRLNSVTHGAAITKEM